MASLTLLIDADTLVYEAARAHEQVVQWDADTFTVTGNLEAATVHFEEAVGKLQDDLKADAVVMALSDYNDPWRKRVMPTYKANRSEKVRPVLFKPLREWCHEKYKTFQRPGLEGDDVLGILLTHPHLIEGEKVCVSVDKDMKTLPGKHYVYGKGLEYSVSTDEADIHHLTQTLTGDRVDGYPGCPGIGPKKAAALLPSAENYRFFHPGEVWAAIVGAYESKGLTEADALQNARVARICRAEDYDFQTKEVRLWNPPR